MKFLDIINELQKENDKSIVLVRCGAFFVAVGKSAVILSEKLNLKVTCMTQKLCKVGIPVNSIYEYIKKLEKLNYSFIIYNYSKDEMVENGKKYAEAYRIIANDLLEDRKCLNCEICDRRKKLQCYDNITLFEDLKRLQEEKAKKDKV